jgi:ABC-type sugar transport system substrate-binding protein
MKSFCVAAILAALTASAASAETIGVSMQSFDNNFQTLLREGLSARASKVGALHCRSRMLRPTSPGSSIR